MAGWGAAVNTAPVRKGQSVAVIGCGGVGDAAVAGAVFAGATTVIAVDRDDRKLDWAKGFGATHTVNATSEDVVARLKELTGGFGPDVVIEAVGRPETYRQAFEARDLAGTVVLVGVPTPEMTVELPLQEVFGRGGALKSSWYGDCLPSRDFPLLIDLFLQGRFDLGGFVTERIPLDGVEEAFGRMHRGEVLRSSVVLDEASLSQAALRSAGTATPRRWRSPATPEPGAPRPGRSSVTVRRTGMPRDAPVPSTSHGIDIALQRVLHTLPARARPHDPRGRTACDA